MIKSIPSFQEEKEEEELEQKVDSPPNSSSNQVNSQPENAIDLIPSTIGPLSNNNIVNSKQNQAQIGFVDGNGNPRSYNPVIDQDMNMNSNF